MAERGLGLVFGGGRVGLMGAIADGILNAGGEAIGVIPDFMVEKELAHPEATQMIITQSMHGRKATMAELSDAFIALPGGIGTLEELIEVYTWLQLRIIDNPIAILNIDNYFDPLISFLDQMVEKNFLKNTHRKRLIVEDDPEKLLDRITGNSYSFEESWYIQN